MANFADRHGSDNVQKGMYECVPAVRNNDGANCCR